MIYKHCKHKRWTTGFANRRIARMYAETQRGIGCGLGYAFRYAKSRR